MSFLNAEVYGNAWTAVGNPRDICFKNNATTCTNTENLQKRKVLDQGGSKEPPYLAAEPGADPAGSSVPLGPVNDGSWRGVMIRTPSNSWYCSSFQAIGEKTKQNKKNNSKRLPELRLSPQPRPAPCVRACTRPHILRRHVREKQQVSFVLSLVEHLRFTQREGRRSRRPRCVCVSVLGVFGSSSFVQQ